ncbi:MAG: hypothetical protein NXH72_14025 [Hyphomonadaceae bacterium]|nr:hypothetical protein [Hyphomonadaceae bacterium]
MTSNWYALAVQPRKEQYVEKQLATNGYRVACPRFQKIVRHARQTKTVLSPLFPGYLFVELDLNSQSWRKANWTPGSIGLIKFDNRPARLCSDFVESFILGLGDNGLAQFDHDLKVGDRVQAVGGPFDRFIGEVIAMSDCERVKVLMEALNRKVEMTLPKSSIVIAA